VNLEETPSPETTAQTGSEEQAVKETSETVTDDGTQTEQQESQINQTQQESQEDTQNETQPDQAEEDKQPKNIQTEDQEQTQQEDTQQEEEAQQEEEEVQEDSENKTEEKKKELMIVKLRNAKHIIEDVNDGIRVLLFVENRKKDLLDKSEGEGLHRTKLIEMLRENREQEDVQSTAMYFTSCKFLRNLCIEMQIDPTENEVVYVTKFQSISFSYSDPVLEMKVMDKLIQNLEEVEDINHLHDMISEKDNVNALIFNTDEDNLEQQMARAKRLTERCIHQCYSEYLYVTIKNKDAFLQAEENKGKTFLLRNGKTILTPFKMKGDGKMALYTTLGFLNNEGLPDVLENSNENYFKIYQNELKAMVVLALNTDNSVKKDMLLEEFTEAAKKHRELRSDFRDRYIFVYSDMIEGDEHYNNMLLEVTGQINADSELYIFTKGNHEVSYRNLSLTENYEGIKEFMQDIPNEIEKANQLIAKQDNQQELNAVEKMTVEFYHRYQNEWQLINGIMKMTEAEEEDSNRITARNILGFLAGNDIGRLHELYYKSEEEDREHNDNNLTRGVLQVTGKNFNRLVYDSEHGDIIPGQRHHSFILLICRKVNEQIEKDCNRISKLITFIRGNFPHEESEIRFGIMDTVLNDHPRIEQMNIKSFPVIAFFGKKNKKGDPKVFRKALVIKKLINWFNRRLAYHEDGIIELKEDDYHALLLLMAKNKR
jgi:hypothetical protein